MQIPQEALAEAERLARFSDEQLIEELGLRAHDAELPGGEERALGFSADFRAQAPDMAGTDFLRKLGQRWWKKLEPELMVLVCKPGNADLEKLIGGRSIPTLAAGLATAAITAAIAAPPAWLIVASTLLAAKLTETGVAALCESWAEARAAPIKDEP